MALKGIETFVAVGDADSTIVRCGLQKATIHPILTIIGEDVDLIVLLLDFASPERNVFFLKPGKGKVESKLYSTTKLQQLGFTDSILLLHSFSGCDTTSAIYKKGKGSMVKLFMKLPSEMKNMYDIFKNQSSTPEMIAKVGEKIFLESYQAKNEQDLNTFRFKAFLKMSSQRKVDLASLPPTRGSAIQHSFRVYLQVKYYKCKLNRFILS